MSRMRAATRRTPRPRRSRLRLRAPAAAPSEGKASGGDGPALLELGFDADAIGRHRRRLTATVERSAGRSRRTAVAAFALPEAVADAAIAANAVVTRSPTRPALDRYTGVVYDGLDVVTMTSAQRSAADEQIVIFSGLFGVVGGGDPVPDYRLPASAVLPRVGVVGTSWRPFLTAALPGRFAGELIVDLRSADYAAMWRPTPSVPTLSLRILTEMPDGRLMVVSYVSKLAKGKLARALIERSSAGEQIVDAGDVVRAWGRERLRYAGAPIRRQPWPPRAHHRRAELIARWSALRAGGGPVTGLRLRGRRLGLRGRRGSGREQRPDRRRIRSQPTPAPDRHTEQERGQRRRRPRDRVCSVAGQIEQFGAHGRNVRGALAAQLAEVQLGGHRHHPFVQRHVAGL